MDSKIHKKIQQVLQNAAKIVNIDEEKQGLSQLFNLLGNKQYKQQDISADLDLIYDKLQFLINKNKQQQNIQLQSFPKEFYVEGVSFQRFILVPGQKVIKQPVYSRCSWFLSALKEKQSLDYYITNSFVKKLQTQFQNTIIYQLNKISINAFNYQFNNLRTNCQFIFDTQLYHKKSSINFIINQSKCSKQEYFKTHQFLHFPFEIYIPCQEYQQNHMLVEIQKIRGFQKYILPSQQVDFQSLDLNLSSLIPKVLFAYKQTDKPSNCNILNILKSRLKEPCQICFSNQNKTIFVFLCCGSFMSEQCLYSQLLNQNDFKCPFCRFELNDQTVDFGLFITLDSQYVQQQKNYQQFQVFLESNLQDNCDQIVIEKGRLVKQNIYNVQNNKCQLFIQLDFIYPGFQGSKDEDLYSKQYLNYHIQKIVYDYSINSKYQEFKVYLYTSQPTIFNHANQLIIEDFSANT